MPKGNTRLELIWADKRNRPKLEPRVLVEALSKSYDAACRIRGDNTFDDKRPDTVISARVDSPEATDAKTFVATDGPNEMDAQETQVTANIGRCR
ncbi:hypothetical protein [Anaerobaca lacustris]|uniref:Uncharacterized protein n=1 Tax=Anaerobaca lacustris TaxID=3044600 RepID=A0AAW6U3L0_9BACT|nr:hypothetical protein [Sedimentisphaerales bacterium M17dextr]